MIEKRKFILIGTMHHMFPEHKEEFKSILEEINPDQILVEIDKKDLDSKNLKTYPKEMLFAYKWALKNKKQVDFFDVDLSLWKNGVSQKDENKIQKEWFKEYGSRDWKFFNRSTKGNREKIWTIDVLLDKKKMNLRQKIMLKNIKKMSAKQGKILILTGAYHLDFFRKNLNDVKLWIK
jgi:hypothetical protein